MSPTLLGWDEMLDPVREDDQADTVVALDRRISKQGGNLGYFLEAVILGNIEALEAITDLDFKQFVPGHGLSGSLDEAVIPYLEYLYLLREVVEAGIEEELQGYEIKQANLQRFDAYSDWAGFDVQLGKHIDKMFLEIEELAW